MSFMDYTTSCNSSSEYLYGKLLDEVEKRDYNGKETKTADVIVDNQNNEISVNVKKSPGTLNILKNNKLTQYDGSEDVTIELHDINTDDFITREEFNEKLPTKTSQLTNDGEDSTSPYATQQWVNEHGVGGNPIYNGNITIADWNKDSDDVYYYSIPRSTYQLFNPICISYLVDQDNEGYENCIYSYKILPDDSIRFKSSFPVNVKYKLQGDNQ